MNIIHVGIRHRIFNPDWTLISLAIYFTLPLVWWNVIREDFSIISSYSIEYVISLLIWSMCLIAYMRSPSTWQRALCLQLGLMLAPTTADVISRVFWSNGRWWVTDLPIPPWKIAVVFLSYGLPWFGLISAPALLAPLTRKWIPAPDARSSKRVSPMQWENKSFLIMLLAWTAATSAGLAVPTLQGMPEFLRIPAALLLMGLLQGLILRRFWRDMLKWTIATAIGLFCGAYLSARYVLADLYLGNGLETGELDNLFVYSTLGAVLGLFQWFVLKRRVENAQWWILVNMFSWTAGGLLLREGLLGFVVTGIVVGVATGTTLLMLNRFPIETISPFDERR